MKGGELVVETFFNLLFAPILWFAIGWYSGRSALQNGVKAGFITALKVFGVAAIIGLSLIGLLTLAIMPT
ncbi:hypothetical protein [Neisseria weaveri]|uniref:hypothetical protein n=1 Tax=Neisseria weaveri TaxID=28091 RepID=UPI00131E68C1|nr:hypothetical protein [Neisseria weaveri]